MIVLYYVLFGIDAVLAVGLVVNALLEMCSAADLAADVQPVRHGQWIPVDEMEDAFDCSECDAMVSKRLNYCPNCGAKMDKEEEG